MVEKVPSPSAEQAGEGEVLSMRGHRQLALIATIFVFFAHDAWAQEPVHRVGFLGIIEHL
jgi:hypothetical protein